jgi:ubiquinone/menaquinone biosynthesis C-methylase UbiE
MDPKTMWGAGDYGAVAENVTGVGDTTVERAGIEAGMEVLDVACGTGNATIPAARLGARVTGLDFQPDLMETARALAAEAGVDVELVEGDAQDLPFEDASFDRVISALGHMFAPDHERMAAERSASRDRAGR